MKTNDFLDELKKELDAAAPEMSARLKNQPIAARADGAQNAGGRPIRPARRRKIFAAAACAAAAVILSASFLPLLFRGGNAIPAASCLYIDINPSLVLTLDENGKVRKAVSDNADGDMFAADEAFAASLVGQNAADAAVAIADRAAKSGCFELLNEGTETDYNEMTVTLKSTADGEETLDGIRSSLVGYFCEEGIYVYVNAESVADKSAGEERDALESRPASYAEWVSSQSDEALAELTEQAAYDYAADLLADALCKYDLFAGIDSLDAEIKADPDNPLSLGYWFVDHDLNDNVRALAAETEKKLFALSLLYDVDTSSWLSYSAARTAYAASVALADVEELRALAAEGFSDETFGGISNLGMRANYFYFVSNDLLYNLSADIWNGVSIAVDGLLEDLEALISDRARTLSERFSELFALPRDPIGEADYLAFLERIGK